MIDWDRKSRSTKYRGMNNWRFDKDLMMMGKVPSPDRAPNFTRSHASLRIKCRLFMLLQLLLLGIPLGIPVGDTFNVTYHLTQRNAFS